MKKKVTNLIMVLLLLPFTTAVYGVSLEANTSYNLVEIAPSMWSAPFPVTTQLMSPGQSWILPVSIRLQAGDSVRFHFPANQNVRVGMTNNNSLNGARWAQSNNGTLIIPSTGDWRFIAQNISSSGIPIGITGTMVPTSAVPFVAELEPFGEYLYDTDHSIEQGQAFQIFTDDQVIRPGYIFDPNMSIILMESNLSMEQGQAFPGQVFSGQFIAPGFVVE